MSHELERMLGMRQSPQTSDTSLPGLVESRPGQESAAAPAPGAASPPSALARYYMTSDLRAATGLTRTHLDFYLREGVTVPTARTESGYLLFDDEELAVLRQVIAWRQDGIGVREIRMRLGRSAAQDADGNGR